MGQQEQHNIPIAKLPNTFGRDEGQMCWMWADTREMAASRAWISRDVGARKRQSSTISLCSRISGDCGGGCLLRAAEEDDKDNDEDCHGTEVASRPAVRRGTSSGQGVGVGVC